jgi:hypothetical protein
VRTLLRALLRPPWALTLRPRSLLRSRQNLALIVAQIRLHNPSLPEGEPAFFHPGASYALEIAYAVRSTLPARASKPLALRVGQVAAAASPPHRRLAARMQPVVSCALCAFPLAPSLTRPARRFKI